MSNPKYKNYKKVFIIQQETWYYKTCESLLAGSENKEPIPLSIKVRLDSPEGGCVGEVTFIWDFAFNTIEVKACHDSWHIILGSLPDLVNIMQDIMPDDSWKGEEKRIPSIKEFASMLKSMGYEDLTERMAPLDTGKTIYDILLETGSSGYDTWDTEFDAGVTVSCDTSLYVKESDAYEKFVVELIQKIPARQTSEINLVAEWSKVIRKNALVLKNFMELFWGCTYTDDDFVLAWIKEFQLLLSGHAPESMYGMFYELAKQLNKV